MNITEITIESLYQLKDIGYPKYPRIVFRCPDELWSKYFQLWVKGNIKYEPMPHNHVLWG